MSELTARDIMTPSPVVVAPEVPVTDAAKLMDEQSVGALPVVRDGSLIGLVTEGDLIMRDVKLEFPTYVHLLDAFIMFPPSTAKFENELRKAVAATVEDVMTEDPVTVSAGATISEVASLLAEKDVSRLPVMDGERLVGIVSKRDIVRSIARGLD